jgi:hypothetical protein
MGDVAVPDRLHLAMDVHQSLLCGHQQRARVVGSGSATVTTVVVVMVVVGRVTPPLLRSDYEVAL